LFWEMASRLLSREEGERRQDRDVNAQGSLCLGFVLGLGDFVERFKGNDTPHLRCIADVLGFKNNRNMCYRK
jgi:hypothetical protein